MKPKNNHINYIELKAHDFNTIKAFYSEAFDWKFIDFGEDYIAFESSGLDGGFQKTDQPITNGAMVILYHEDLELSKSKVKALGAKITVDIFSFPGGQRFQFLDPSGNELAVWCHA